MNLRAAAGVVLDDSTYVPYRLPVKAGDVAIDRVADDFHMSKSQLADTAGLAREAFYKVARVRAAKTQTRMREMLEIISRIEE